MKISQINERGSIAIETLIAFIGLILFTAIIVTFVNIAAMQLRVNHALTQTAKEISFYTYALRVFGVANLIGAMDDEAADVRGELDEGIGHLFGIFDAVGDATAAGQDIISNTQAIGSNPTTAIREMDQITDSLSDSLSQIQAAGSNISGYASSGIGLAEGWMNDPAEFFQGLMWTALNEGAGIGLSYLLGGVIAPSFFWRYMGIEGGPEGPVYFDNMPGISDTAQFVWWPENWFGDRARDGIGGGLFRPDHTHFLSSVHGSPNSDEIVVGIRYQIDLTRFFILPDDLRLYPQVVQQVKTRAFIGDGGRFGAPHIP